MGKSVSELAQALSENERKELSERIKRSLSLAKPETETIIRQQNTPDNRKHHIEEGLAKLSFFQRLILQIKKIFTNKSETDLFVESKMGELARNIDLAGVSDSQTGAILPDFANDMYRLYVSVVPIKRFLSIIWNNEDGLKGAVQYVLEQKIPKARSGLYQFLPLDEIQLLFEHAESKGTIRQELLTRVNSYLESIPGEVFTDLETQLMPLYYLRQLCFFDYLDLFRLFYADQSSIEKGNPNFKASQFKRVIEAIEDLYYAMFTARKASNLEVLPPQLYKYVQNKRYELDQKEVKTAGAAKEVFGDTGKLESPDSPETKNMVMEEGIKQLRKDLHNLQEVLNRIIEHSKIADIIRFFRGDPYYRFLAYAPAINLKEFYVASLRMSLLQTLDQDFGNIRKKIIENIVTQLFPHGVFEFEFFKRFPYGTIRNNLPGFRYVTSLQYLHNFLQKVFYANLREVFRSIVKSLPNRNKDIGNEILFNTSNLETISEKLKGLDASFNPDHDNGKAYMRIKMSLEKDLGAERQYRQYIAQRDKENRDLLEEAIEHLKVLSSSIDEVSNIPVGLLTERFAFAVGQGANISEFLRAISIKLRNSNRLLRYQRALDDEGFEESKSN